MQFSPCFCATSVVLGIVTPIARTNKAATPDVLNPGIVLCAEDVRRQRARGIREAEPEDEKIRVACLGDSITKGARTRDPNSQSYPARLQAMLSDGWTVRNFGIGGATLLKKGRPNIWKNLRPAKRFRPHIVIVMLGTNDTVSGKRKNWERIDEFSRDCKKLIEEFRTLPTRPTVYLCGPTAMVLETPGLSPKRRANLTERRPRLEKLRGMIERIAEKEHVRYLDLGPVLQGHPELVTPGDGVHPNVEGYKAIAKRIHGELRRNRLTRATTEPASRSRP